MAKQNDNSTHNGASRTSCAADQHHLALLHADIVEEANVSGQTGPTQR